MPRPTARQRSRMGTSAPGISGAIQALRNFQDDVTGAKTPAMRDSAKVLAKHMRRQVAERGHGEPAAPGEAPHRQVGTLHKSIGYEVVDSVMRVGSGHFTARLQEEGHVGKDGDTVAPRPFMDASLQSAREEMTHDVVATLQKAGGGA